MLTVFRRDDAAARAATRENSPRLAQEHATFSSHGWGEFEVAKPDMFSATFIEEPAVSYGYALDGDTLVPKRFPRAFGGVSKWALDEKGFYIGAWVFLVVDTLSPAIIAGVPAVDPGYDITHSFTFAGTAIKDVEQWPFDE